MVLFPLPREEYRGQELRRYRDAEDKVGDVRKLKEELERITSWSWLYCEGNGCCMKNIHCKYVGERKLLSELVLFHPFQSRIIFRAKITYLSNQTEFSVNQNVGHLKLSEDEMIRESDIKAREHLLAPCHNRNSHYSLLYCDIILQLCTTKLILHKLRTKHRKIS